MDVRQRLTLEEIGRLAGVSRSTVSRVINGQPDVSAEAKKRVLAVIDDTGFQPNQAARSLVSVRTNVLGLVIPSAVHNLFADPYFGRLIQGITKAANTAGQTLSLFLFEDESEETALYPRVIASGLLDGLIVTATRVGDPLVVRLLRDRVPFVMVGRPDNDDITHVDVDNRGGARIGTEHLLQHGHQRIGMVAAPSNTTTGADRRAGFLDAMVEAGIEVPPSLIVEGDYTSRGGYEAMNRLLDTRPDAVFCASDTMALGVLRALADAGLRCPDDMALVSFDGLIEADESGLPITTVQQPIRQTGEEAVSLLLDLVDDDGETQPVRRTLSTELVVRRSCGCGGVGMV